MIRDLTKSALSFSWALSLLGAEQAINLLRPGQRNRGNVFAPMTQAAANQLDESMKGFYRTGDNVQGRLVDMAFSWLNPGNWINPSNWSNMAHAGDSKNRAASVSGLNDLGRMFNPLNWMTSANHTSEDDCGCSQQPQAYSQDQTFTQGASSGQTPQQQSGTAPVANESSVSAWGSMPEDIS